MTTKHTPAKWQAYELNGRNNGPTWAVDGPSADDPDTVNGGYSIAHLFGPDAKANAALIARAPELEAENQRLRELLNQAQSELHDVSSTFFHSKLDMEIAEALTPKGTK